MVKLPTSVTGRVAAATLALSMAGAGAIVAHEGMRKVAYVDPVGVVTVCAGHTLTAKLGQVKTPEECAVLLQQDVEVAQTAVKRLVKVHITQDQFNALVSFTFNVGEGNFAKSTLLRKANAGDCWGAGAEFPRWTKAGGKELPGLVTRRAEERKQWEKGCAPSKYTFNQSSRLYASFNRPSDNLPSGRFAVVPIGLRRELVDSV
jgi:lysozyme